MCFSNSSPFKAKAAKTSFDEEVTPPLFAVASLIKTTPRSSKYKRASGEMNKLAPSTMYLIFGVPSLLNNLWTLLMLMESGLPPAGTNKSASNNGFKWKLLRNSKPDSTTNPFGKVTFSWPTKTLNPCGDNFFSSNSLIMTLLSVKTFNSSLERPFGS